MAARATLAESVQVLKNGEKLDLAALIRAASTRVKPIAEAKPAVREGVPAVPLAPSERTTMTMKP